jgi:hypothetical protein
LPGVFHCPRTNGSRSRNETDGRVAIWMLSNNLDCRRGAAKAGPRWTKTARRYRYAYRRMATSRARNCGHGRESAGARCPSLSRKAIKTLSPRREGATSEQLGRHERKTVDGVRAVRILQRIFARDAQGARQAGLLILVSLVRFQVWQPAWAFSKEAQCAPLSRERSWVRIP